MFGWINDCTESLVITKFGVDKWDEIKKKAGCSVENGGFIRHEYYTDESTVALVIAASEVLGISVDDVLEAFGQYFMEFTRNNGYVNLLSCQGSTLRLWLSNLNALHDHLQSSLPKKFVAPVFWCEDDEEEEGSILLHYFSKRGRLLVPLAAGVVKEVARYHFQVEITMDLTQIQGEEGKTYTSWRISAIDPSQQWKLTRTEAGEEEQTAQPRIPSMEDIPSDGPRVGPSSQCPFSLIGEQMKNSSLHAKDKRTDQSIGISGGKMKEIFPYHIVVNSDFDILQVGNSISNLINDQNMIGKKIGDCLRITKPVLGSWDWESLQKMQDQTFFIETVSDEELPTKLKGNIVNLSTDPLHVMFILSPDAKNVSELTEMGLTMSDLPLHSFQRDAVFLGEHIASEVKSAHKLDRLSKKLANERNLSNTLLFSMLPIEVANRLRSGQSYEPEHHDDVTLFFSDVVGFTNICSDLPPWDVIDMLNRLYCVMDFLAEKFDLYKVETIGDAYMCCSGLPEPEEANAEKIANFAIAVRECVKLVTSPIDGKPIQLRIGIHSGACMSGVVGTLTPHYCLFGDMINVTSRHESTGEPDRIQSSSITYGKLQHFSPNPEFYVWEPRGLIDMKGKGMMYTYWLKAGGETNPHVGPEPLKRLFDETKDMLSKKTWKKRSYFMHGGGSTSSTRMTMFDNDLDMDLK